MGNNITTLPERPVSDDQSSSTSTITGNRTNSNNEQRNASLMSSSIVSFPFRRTGLLGLSKAELDQRCKPSGLYKSCSWDERTIRRLIADGKLAARLVGSDQEPTFSPMASQLMSNSPNLYLHECPICFLQYAQVNVATCCAASICTECYLQVHPPKEKSAATCPFCNNPSFDVRVAKQLEEEYVLQREEEEQKVIEATIRSRSGNLMISSVKESPSSEMETPDESVTSITATNSSNDASAPVDEFGSNLVRRLRARTESLSARDSLNRDSFMTMSPEERRQLEMEMKDQKSHPLVRMLELEAEETRHRHEVEHSERVSRNRFLRRGSLSRRLVQQVGMNGDTNESVGRSSVQNVINTEGPGDGLRMLETALFVAMEERSLRDRMLLSESLHVEDADGSDSSHSDAMALLQELLSRRQQLHERQSTSNRAIQRRLALEAQLEAATNMLLSLLPEEDQLAMAMAMSLRESNVPQDDMNSEGENNVLDSDLENATPLPSDRMEALSLSETDPYSTTADTSMSNLVIAQSSSDIDEGQLLSTDINRTN